MKKMNLMFDQTGWEATGTDKGLAIPEITRLVINNVMLGFAEQKGGLMQEDRHLCYKVMDTMEKAVKDGLTEVELEDDQFGFIKKCLKETKLGPGNLLRKIEALVLAVKER